jgi:hypothetical protein
MGAGQFNSIDYDAAVNALQSTGTNFARSAAAASTGNFTNIAEILNPRKLKNGVRESCFAPGFNDATAIVVSIDGTGSMEQIPFHIQQQLPKLLELLTEKGVSDHPNVLFMCHDDELIGLPDAVFQMSQFEIESTKLISALNEMIIPGQGGGNQGEAYHLSFYAAANHTRMEAFERDGAKGFFFMICDEEPFYHAGDPTKEGTSPAIAKEVFGDTIEATVTMLESVKKVCERYHVFILRPGHTSHGKNKTISRMWQDLLRKAGENPEHVLEVEETEAIIPTIALSIGRLADVDEDDLVDVLKAKGAAGIDSAIQATRAIVPVGNRQPAVVGKASGALATEKGTSRQRR